MSLEAKVMDELKAAMRSKDQGALRALRAIKSKILLAKTTEGRDEGPLSEDEEMKLLMKEAKQRRDSIQQFKENGRDDLAGNEQEELEVIERFLPQQLSAEELETEVRAIVEQTGASSMADMGKVMGLASQKLAGRTDGKAISVVVKKLLG